MKAKVTFNLDLSGMDIPPTQAAAEEYVLSVLLAPARAQHIKNLHEVRKDKDMDLDLKAIKMAEQLLRIKLTLFAEANMSTEVLPDDFPISSQLPFEKRYLDREDIDAGEDA